MLGADGKADAGIALYNLKTGVTTDVWHPSDMGWSKYTYSMVAAGGMYYAGFHIENNTSTTRVPYGILVSRDGVLWDKLYEFIGTEDITRVFLAPGEARKMYLSWNGLLYWFQR